MEEEVLSSMDRALEHLCFVRNWLVSKEPTDSLQQRLRLAQKYLIDIEALLWEGCK